MQSATPDTLRPVISDHASVSAVRGTNAALAEVLPAAAAHDGCSSGASRMSEHALGGEFS